GDCLAAADFADGVLDATGLTAAALTGAGLAFPPFAGSALRRFNESFFGAAFAGPGFAADLLRAAPALSGRALACALAGCGRLPLLFTSVFRTFQLHCRAHPAECVAQFLHAFIGRRGDRLVNYRSAGPSPIEHFGHDAGLVRGSHDLDRKS